MSLDAEASDTFHLQRFVDAQGPVYAQVVLELSGGRKRSHWMWFVFPQVQGLGSSSMAREFAISGMDEAMAYLRHPLLGERLRACTQLVNEVEGRNIQAILGYPDDLKFHSCMTLFHEAAGRGEMEAPTGTFAEALRKYFGGKVDEATLVRLATAERRD